MGASVPLAPLAQQFATEGCGMPGSALGWTTGVQSRLGRPLACGCDARSQVIDLFAHIRGRVVHWESGDLIQPAF